MKEHRHYGVYGLVIENDKILLINKVTGPYDGKLDLPGGSFEFGDSVYEIEFDSDVPTGVAINEAVELAKRYGTDQSAAFVNAILAKLA